LAEIPLVNKDLVLLAGHQRCKILAELKGGDYEIEVRVSNVQLNKEEADEYLVRSNKNNGEWDMDILANDFDISDLIEWGFEAGELGIDLEDEQVEPDDKEENDTAKIVLECDANDKQEVEEFVMMKLKETNFNVRLK